MRESAVPVLCSAAQGTGANKLLSALGMHVELAMQFLCFKWGSANMTCGSLPALPSAAQCVLFSVSSSVHLSGMRVEIFMALEVALQCAGF